MRLPEIPGSRAQLRRWVGFLRERRAALGYVAFTVVVFVLALAWTLPHEQIATRALESVSARTPFTASFADVSFAFPNGYRFTGLRLVPKTGAGVPIGLSAFTVRTPLLALLTGDPSRANFAGTAYGGDFAGEVVQADSRLVLEAVLTDVDLGQALAGILPPPAKVAGRASLDLSLTGDGRSTQSSEGALHLTISELGLDDVIVRDVMIPDLRFSELDLRAQIHGPRLVLEELRATGPELSAGASGEVLVREPLVQSVLNLRFTVDVPPGAPPGLRLVTALLPRKTGAEPSYTLKGTPAAPIVR